MTGTRDISYLKVRFRLLLVYSSAISLSSYPQAPSFYSIYGVFQSVVLESIFILTYPRGIDRDLKHFSDDNSKFRPERYLNEYGELYDFLPESRGEGHLSFGSGRRYLCSCGGHSTHTDLTLQHLRWQRCC